MPVPQEFRFEGTRREVKPLTVATPSPQPNMVSAPMRTSQPVPQPQPAPAPVARQSIPQNKSTFTKITDALNYPAKITEKLVTGGKGYESAYDNPNSFVRKVANNMQPALPILKAVGIDPFKNKTVNKIASEGSRFAYDPLNIVPVGVGSKVLSKASKVTGLSKAGAKISNFAKSVPALTKAVEVFNPYFRNPEFGKVVQAAERNTGTKISSLYDNIKKLSANLTQEEQVHIGEIMEGIAKPKSSQYANIARQATNITKDIGQEAVKEGLMTKETFAKMSKKGYLSHIESLLPDLEKASLSQRNVVARSFSSQFKKRTGKLEDYVKEFAPVAFKGLGSEVKAIETAKMYKQIAGQFGKKIGRGSDALPGFIRASEAGIEGSSFAKAFKGKQIPTEVAEYINRTIKKTTPSWYQKYFVNPWKVGKTILNPAYHARNLASNQILSSMSTGKNLVSTTIDYARNLKEYRSGSSKIFNAAKEAGLIGRTAFGTGLNDLIDAAGLSGKKGGNIIQKAISGVGKVTDKAKAFQNLSEESAKFNVFKTWMEKFADDAGMKLDDALKNKELIAKARDKAEEAIFSPYRLGKEERSVLGKIFPFYSFTRQALPFTAKTLVDNPKSIGVFGKAKDAIERGSEDPGVELPDYLRDQIRLGNKDGKARYFDPKYIYPFGNFTEMGGEGKLPFGLSTDPLATEILQQAIKRDFYFNRPILQSNLSEKNLTERIDRLFRMVAPQFVNTVKDKIVPAVIKYAQGNPDARLGDAILSIFGIKTSTVDLNKVQTQNLRSKNYDQSQINQEIDQTINDPNMSREDKDRDIQKLRSLNP